FPDLAVSWLRYLTSPEVQAQQLTQLPIWTSLQNSPDLHRANSQIDVFLTNLAYARPRPKLTRYVEASAVLQRHLHDLVLGSASICWPAFLCESRCLLAWPAPACWPPLPPAGPARWSSASSKPPPCRVQTPRSMPLVTRP